MPYKEKLRSIYHFLSPSFQTIHLEYKVQTRPRFGYDTPPHPLLNSIINKNRGQYAETLRGFLQYEDFYKSIQALSNDPESPDVHWNNEYLPGLDIISLY